MEAKLQRRVQRYGWDKASPHYEAYWQHQLEPAQARLLELAELQPGEHVLDVACGTGLVSVPAVRAVGSAGEVVGVDLSEKMTEMAAHLAQDKGLTNLHFKRMDAEKLEFSDETFDVVLCALGLMYMPDPLKALEEMKRVLKPGGRTVVAVWGKRSNCGWAEIFPIVDKKVKSEVCPMFFSLGNSNALLMALEHSGFTAVESVLLSTQIQQASEGEALGAAFLGGPVALAYSQFDEATKAEVHAEFMLKVVDDLEKQAAYHRG